MKKLLTLSLFPALFPLACFADMYSVVYQPYPIGLPDALLLVAAAAGYLLYRRNNKPDA